ncbi:MAG: ABC transporter ATP-binding protein [Acidimicrobiales bacterium]
MSSTTNNQPTVDRTDDAACGPRLEVRDLTVRFQTQWGHVAAVRGVSLTVPPRRTLGIVGESGAGKSALVRAIMGLQPRSVDVRGSVRLDGHELVGQSLRAMRRVWGTQMAMVFQDPMTSLNPVHRIGAQVTEKLRAHGSLSRAEARDAAVALLTSVGIPEPGQRIDQYPHQLSGGMRQRVVIAIAMACEPTMLLADEPTTALDVTIQAQILDLLAAKQAERDMSMIIVTHDLGIVAGRTNQVIVMYAGRVVEQSPTAALFAGPRMPYTEALLKSIPSLEYPSHAAVPAIPGVPPPAHAQVPGCDFAPRCSYATDKCRTERPPLAELSPGRFAACWYPLPAVGRSAVDVAMRPSAARLNAARAVDGSDRAVGSPPGEVLLEVRDLVVEYKVKKGTVHAVSEVSFDVMRGETLGLVGESGCGKSTTGRAILQLQRASSGTVRLEGTDLTLLSARELRDMRHRAQMIFQDPISSLNPRRTARNIIAEPLRATGRSDRLDNVDRMLAAVGLSDADSARRPSELSGGQCQRVSIARALALEPDLLVCDEPVSALDVSIQAQILDLLEEVKDRYGLTMVFIAHDLGVVKNVSDRVAVMYLGRLCEIASPDVIYRSPLHPYTSQLLAAVPRIEDAESGHTATAGEDKGDIPSPIAPPSGCRFRTRCPKAQAICAELTPTLREVAPEHAVACHFPNDVVSG